MSKRLTLATAAALLAAVGLLPVLAMLVKTFFVNGALSVEAYRSLLLAGPAQWSLMGHSLLLAMLTTFLAVVVGTSLGVVLAKTDLPLRRGFAVLFTIPLLIPPYVLAVAWSAAPGDSGQVVHELLFGPVGCTGVLFTAFMPIVMLLTIAYAGALDPRWEDAARLVSRWPGVLRRITLPMIAPTVLFAAVVVFLLTLGEVGVPTYLRYPVYAVETLTQFAAFHDFGAATVAAMPMLVVTLAVLALEYRWLHQRVLALEAVTPGARRAQIQLGGWRTPLLVLITIWAFITVAFPLAMLVMQSSSISSYADAFARASDSIARSLALAAVGATLLTVLGFLCGYLVYNRSLPIWRGVDALALFLFTLPGTVIGVGLISLWNTPLTNSIYGTSAIIILGYLAQYAVLPLRMTSAILGRIPGALEQAARLGGASWLLTLRHIVVPLAQRGLIAAWLISYVFCLRDLGSSAITYPPGSDTLSIRILTLMANGAPSLIASLCVILVLITLLPLGAATLWLRRCTVQP
ncbi:MAG: ABC transporter permease [Burkholderiales bacterium]